MSLQIKEVHIKVTVDADGGQSEPQNTAGGGSLAEASASVDKSTIIAECVEQVMQILKEKMEP